MKIIIGSDHGGIKLKKEIISFLKAKKYKIKNMGVDTEKSVDYPDIAETTCLEFKKEGYDLGILVCGTGIGISIAANKIKGIRCALLSDIFSAKMAKAHNNANFIAFGGRMTYKVKVTEIIETFINTSFEGGRHNIRVNKIMSLEDR